MHANSASKYLKPHVHSPSAIARVRAAMRRISGSATLSELNYAKRIALHDAIFEIENEIESRGDGHPDDPTVLELNRVRNLVLDDLGWNEYDPPLPNRPAYR